MVSVSLNDKTKQDLEINFVFKTIPDKGSPEGNHYNCVAWALNITDKWYDPDPNYYWPSGIKQNPSVEAYIQLFDLHGYFLDSTDNAEFDPEYEKLAMYVHEFNEFGHVARQLETGLWTSKLGTSHDIEHELEDLKGRCFGNIIKILKRKRSRITKSL